MKEKVISRTVWVVSLVSLFTDVASEMLYPVMPVYLKSIGFSVVLIGILEGLAEATAGLSKGYFGHWSDRIGKRVPFIRAGYSLSAISKPMMALLTFPLWVFFARTLDRFGKGIRTSARDALLSAETTPEHKGKVFGFHRSMDTVGAAIGPILALVFLHFYPGEYQWMFIIAFFPGIFSILLTYLLRDRPTPTSSNHRIIKSSHHLFAYFKYWSVAGKQYRLLVIGLLAFTLFNSSDVFLLLAMKEKGLSDTWMIGAYIFYNLVYAIFSYPIGMLADRIGLRTMLISGLFLFSVVYACVGFVSSAAMFGVLFFIYGIYAASTEGISKALISNLTGKENTATAIGFYNSLASICTLLASTLAGIIWFTYGPVATFLVSGIVVACVALFLGLVFSRK